VSPVTRDPSTVSHDQCPNLLVVSCSAVLPIAAEPPDTRIRKLPGSGGAGAGYEPSSERSTYCMIPPCR
jgi:hypothetical protein